MADDQQQPPDQPGDPAAGPPPPDRAGPDQTRQFPAASGDETVARPAGGDETSVLPAADAGQDQADDHTAVFPPATGWSGRAGVPPPVPAGVGEVGEVGEEWQEPEPPGRRWWLPVLLGLFALALLALVGVGLWLALRQDENPSTPGAPVASATTTPSGPGPTSRGAPTTGGTTPTRNAPQRVVVPRLVGMETDIAQAVLDDVGLTYRLTYRASSTAPPGTVLEVVPGEGSVVAKGTEVTLVIARAAPTTGAPPPSGAPTSPAATSTG